MKDDSMIWLDQPIHKNKVRDIDLSKIDTIKLSFDGSIMAVEADMVKAHYVKNKVSMIKAGYEKMPDSIDIKCEDDLYNFLSYFITI